MTTLTMESLRPLISVQSWPMSIWVLLFAALATFIAHYVQRPPFPDKAPRLGAGNWPILGAIRYFSRRANFVQEGRQASQTGNFSFYWGKRQIVNVSGTEGRKFFFDSPAKELDFARGYAVLYGGSPQVLDSETDRTSVEFSKTLLKLLRKENLVRLLPTLVPDTQNRFEAVIRRSGTSGMLDPFDDLYGIVYQLTMRTVGATEIAESPAMLAKTLRLFENIERSVSPVRLVFSWLPTLNQGKRMLYGAQLYMAFQKIAKARRESGRREEDAMQMLIDDGTGMVDILAFVLGALFAGQLNSGINAAWAMLFLGHNAEWRARVRDEVDAAVEKHRDSPDQKPMDVLRKLTVDDWEQGFPTVDLVLRETIRLSMCGTAPRLNTSGRDLPIGKTGEVLPRDGFAIYWIGDCHQNPDIYPEPSRWDPGRYLPDRAEDKKAEHGYVGWGVGRHPCLGMRFAKLEMAIITACFAALFDWTSVDVNGKPLEQLPHIDQNRYSAHKPETQMRLRYTVREGAW